METVKLYMGQTLFGFRYERIEGKGIPAKNTGVQNFSHPHVYLSLADKARWKYASEALEYGLLEAGWGADEVFVKGQYIRNGVYEDRGDSLHDTLCDRNVNWPSDIQLTRIRTAKHISWAYAGFVLAGTVYGGLHLVAWNAPFASSVEKLLWRSSGLVLVLSGPVCALVFVVRTWFKDGVEEWKDEPLRYHRAFFVRVVVIGFQSWISTSYHLATFLLVLSAFCYLTARVYLVVECFINMAHLPEDVFKVPTWTQYFPHII
ncbi:uncharacterized protein K452DRAFT_361857 [Aplosporella prunicola CBS 121167]|uniref:Uncharacterized protein n=1 Tax=Aplosporella prunicola CBS 121167 TaxID=1176127 RepID=A0A6A6B2L5_9PEZI|nr:uncharacterized protein K452DRAFT_361857 [Aplosporella prunicola CBS 121167]KAF2137495.1 hypothetical protein K452DRAFT_361857 [Aplosporella prunicola CBS 121167]